MKILVINGPNLNRLGKREKDIYGTLTLDDINDMIVQKFKGSIEMDFFQSNEEGSIVTKIGESEEDYDGVVINPGAYSHYSIAILDAIRSITIPVIEVHLTNIYKREEYRRKSVTAEGCIGVVSGFGAFSYIMALEFLKNSIENSSY